MVVVINIAITSPVTHRGIASIQTDSREFRARGSLKFAINSTNLREAHVLQLLVVAPVIWHKTDYILREVVHRRYKHQKTVQPQQKVLIAMCIAALNQNLVKIHSGARLSASRFRLWGSCEVPDRDLPDASLRSTPAVGGPWLKVGLIENRSSALSRCHARTASWRARQRPLCRIVKSEFREWQQQKAADTEHYKSLVWLLWFYYW